MPLPTPGRRQLRPERRQLHTLHLIHQVLLEVPHYQLDGRLHPTGQTVWPQVRTLKCYW